MNIPIIGAKRGFFVSMEGLDATGKTTQAKLLQQALEMTGFKVKVVRAPGGCQLAESIRKITKDPSIKMSAESELLLMCAATSQSAQEVIKPALDEGYVVISDRYHFSTVSYQSARGLDPMFIKAALQFSLKDILPDVTFVLYLSKEETEKRRAKRNTTDRFEQENQEYLDKVRANYDWFCRQESTSNGRIIAIDTKDTIENIHQEIYKCVAARLSVLPDSQLELAGKIIKP